MSGRGAIRVERWSARFDRARSAPPSALLVVLAAGPLAVRRQRDRQADDAVHLCHPRASPGTRSPAIGGLVSIGQQAFFGLGAYAAVRLADAGVSVYLASCSRACSSASCAADFGLHAAPEGPASSPSACGSSPSSRICSSISTRWCSGETGTSLIALNAYPAETRHALDLLDRARRDGVADRRCCSRLLRSRSAPRSRRSATTRRPPRRSACASCAPSASFSSLAAFGAAPGRRALARDRDHLSAEDLFQRRNGPPT